MGLIVLRQGTPMEDCRFMIVSFFMSRACIFYGIPETSGLRRTLVRLECEATMRRHPEFISGSLVKNKKYSGDAEINSA